MANKNGLNKLLYKFFCIFYKVKFNDTKILLSCKAGVIHISLFFLSLKFLMKIKSQHLNGILVQKLCQP